MRRTLSAAVLMACAGSALGGPLMAERVLPDATWVVHVDVEAIAGSNICRTLLGTHIGAEIRADIAEDAMEELGIDPLKDVRGVTVFGHSEIEGEALVLVSATEAIDVPLGKLPEVVKEYREIREGARVVHTWKEEDETVYAYAAPGRGAGERVVLFSGNFEELRRGMLRLETGGAEVAPALERGRPGAGAFFFFAASEIPDLVKGEDDPPAMLLRHAKGVALEVGEQGNELRGDARITTAGAEEAGTMLQVVQGLMALGRMAVGSEPDLAPLSKFFDGCRASTEGSALTVSVRIDAAALHETIKILDEEHRQGLEEGEEEEEEIREELKKVEKARGGEKKAE